MSKPCNRKKQARRELRQGVILQAIADGKTSTEAIAQEASSRLGSITTSTAALILGVLVKDGKVQLDKRDEENKSQTTWKLVETEHPQLVPATEECDAVALVGCATGGAEEDATHS